LYQKGTPEKVAYGYLTKKNTPPFIKMQSYATRDLEQVVMDFIKETEAGKGLQERPTIKFTLRITPQMERYLQWKAKRIKKTKADFLREFLEELMDKDEVFKK
jgi:hypothetical protein